MKSSAVILACLLISSLAYAGKESSGGGNTVNLNLIEEFAEPLENISGFKEYTQPKLKEIAAVVPGFVDALSDEVQSLTFYLIPRKLLTLPRTQTGLRFNSEQPAYQRNNEVFISKTLFEQMSLKQRGQLLLHELLEHFLFTRYEDATPAAIAQATRLMMVYILSHPQLNGKELANTLEERGFGSYACQAQLDDIQNWAIAIVQKQIELTCNVSHVVNYTRFVKQASELFCKRYENYSECLFSKIPVEAARWHTPDRLVLPNNGPYAPVRPVYEDFGSTLWPIFEAEANAQANANSPDEASQLQKACDSSKKLLSDLKNP